MKKLEKSLRHCMATYGSLIRGGKHYNAGHATGDPSNRVSGVFADISGGIVTNVTIYCYGDAKEKRHYYHNGCVEITAPLEEYINGATSWDEMIHNMVDIIAA